MHQPPPTPPQEVLHKLFPLPVTLGGGGFLCALIILKKPVVIFLIEGPFNQVLERLALLVTQGSAQTSSLRICLLPITCHSLKLSWVFFVFDMFAGSLRELHEGKTLV